MLRPTESLRLSIALHILGAGLIMQTSGCATAFVRSKSTVAPEHAFPATAFDAQFFWSNGIKGEPLFAMADSNYREGPPLRVVRSLGAIVDFPLSIVFDTLLLPVDLTQAKKTVEKRDSKQKAYGVPAIAAKKRFSSH